MAIVIIWASSSCQQYGYCPPSKHTKLRKSSGYSLRAYRLDMREKALARKEARAQHKQLLKVYNVEGKKVEEMVDWDCPRPGSRLSRQIRKQMRKNEKLHEQALRRDEKAKSWQGPYEPTSDKQ